MRIILNNRECQLEKIEKISLEGLLSHQKFVFPNIITKVNGKTVKKENRKDVIINEGDKVDAIHMVSGG